MTLLFTLLRVGTRLACWLMLALLASCTSPTAVTIAAPPAPASDGPHVFFRRPELKLLSFCSNGLQRQQVTVAAPVTFLPDHCGAPFTVPVRPPVLPQTDRHYRGVEKLAVMSDIHGQYELMRAALQNNGVINNAGDWTFGSGHLVVIGDVFDRGPQVTEALWLRRPLPGLTPQIPQTQANHHHQHPCWQNFYQIGSKRRGDQTAQPQAQHSLPMRDADRNDNDRRRHP